MSFPRITITLVQNGNAITATGADGLRVEHHTESASGNEVAHETARRAAAAVVSRLHAHFDSRSQPGVIVLDYTDGDAPANTRGN